MTLHGCVVTLNRIEVYDTHVEVLEDVRLVNHVLVFLAMLRSSKSFLRPQGTDDENSGDHITVCVLLLYVFIGQSISANPPDCLLKGDLPHMSTSPTISLVLESFGRIPTPTDSQKIAIILTQSMQGGKNGRSIPYIKLPPEWCAVRGSYCSKNQTHSSR